MVQNERLVSSERIGASSQVRRLFRRGRTLRGDTLSIVVISGAPRRRAAFVVARGTKGSVRRNRIRRRLRELYRRNRSLLPGDVEIVLVGNERVLESDWHLLERETRTLFSRAQKSRMTNDRSSYRPDSAVS